MSEMVSAPKTASLAHAGVERARRWFALGRPWLFLVVPSVAVLELVVHFAQVTSHVQPAQWSAARAAVKAMVLPTDLIAFAPEWVDPVGRSYFGDELASVTREARPDDTRFARVIEVSAWGGHLDEFEHWRTTQTKKVGPITLTVRENPSYRPLIDDLLQHADAHGMQVARIEGTQEQACPWTHGSAQAGGLGAGPTVPGDRFVCSGGSFVGITVLPALDYSPHRCFFAPPPGGNSALRIRFLGVAFGKMLHGHHGVSVHAERDLTGAPVTLTFATDEGHLGKVTHHDGDGWKSFEFDTTDLNGKKTDLVVEVSAANANGRQYCFEADTQ